MDPPSVRTREGDERVRPGTLMPADSVRKAAGNPPANPGRVSVVIPLPLRIDARGGVFGDTTLVENGRALRVRIERRDTVANR